MAVAMKMSSGRSFATVAIVFSAAACLMPRSTSACTPHSSTDAPSTAAGVEPSPKIGMNVPSVALIRIRQASCARQQVIQ
jgi:hypothetical protein